MKYKFTLPEKLRDWILGYDHIDLPLTKRELELLCLKREYIFCRGRAFRDKSTNLIN